MTHPRTNNLVTRLDDDEIQMARELSEALDMPMTQLVRRWLRNAYVERFGVTPPKKKSG